MALCIPYSAASKAAKGPTRHKFERYTELDNAKALWIAGRHSLKARIARNGRYCGSVARRLVTWLLSGEVVPSEGIKRARIALIGQIRQKFRPRNGLSVV